MQAIAPAAAWHRATGELVNDYDFTILDDVFDVTLVNRMCSQSRVEVMQQADVAGVVKAFAFLQESGLRHQRFNLLVAFLSDVRLLRL